MGHKDLRGTSRAGVVYSLEDLGHIASESCTAPDPHSPKNIAGLRSCTPSKRAIQTSGPNTAPSRKRRVSRDLNT